MNDSTRYHILRILDGNPEISQREMARELGLSLGKTNYCIRAVIEKGWVKARNFRNSENKAAYLYQLTPSGIAAKGRITRRFLDRKLKEYQKLEQEIADLRREVESRQPQPTHTEPLTMLERGVRKTAQTPKPPQRRK